MKGSFVAFFVFIIIIFYFIKKINIYTQIIFLENKLYYNLLLIQKGKMSFIYIFLFVLFFIFKLVSYRN